METSLMEFRNILFFLVLLIGISACDNKKYSYSDTGNLIQEAEYNNNGELHGLVIRYSEQGFLHAKINFKNGIKHGEEIHFDSVGNIISIYNMINGEYDTIKYFYESGELKRILYPKNDNFYEKSFFKSGEISNEGLRERNTENFLGWWKIYNERGLLISKIEFININGEVHENQIVNYDKYGFILKEESSFFNFNFPDTLIKDKITHGLFNLNTNLSKERDFYEVFFDIQDEEGNTIFKDTSFGQNEKAAIIDYRPKKVGKFKLNGVALERGHNIEPSKEDSTMLKVDYLSRRIYFDKLFVVVE